LRPVLTLLGATVIRNKESKAVLGAAVAVEFIHSSSLIFDDLPAMDDAKERRGKTSLHNRFGEPIAILVALALLNACYGILHHNSAALRQRIQRFHHELVKNIGPEGLIGGQFYDLIGATKERIKKLSTLKSLKTRALIRLSLRSGAILAGADEGQLKALTRYGDLIGHAYQIKDDLMDIQEDKLRGRGTSSVGLLLGDKKNEEANLISIIEEAKEEIIAEFKNTKSSSLLCQMADFIVSREA
jgi:geranylgeranyl diphosphate synthase type II